MIISYFTIRSIGLLDNTLPARISSHLSLCVHITYSRNWLKTIGTLNRLSLHFTAT